jgi:sec-independent protein translocase protein TatB
VFGIDSTELLVIAVVALVVIGPKDLPRVLYKVGKVVGQARSMARHFRTGLDAMIREAELEDLQKQWAKENERIMAAHPVADPVEPEKALVDERAVMTGPPLATSVEEVLGKEAPSAPAAEAPVPVSDAAPAEPPRDPAAP